MKRINVLADRAPRPVLIGIKVCFYALAAITFPVWFFTLIAIWLLLATLSAVMDFSEHLS